MAHILHGFMTREKTVVYYYAFPAKEYNTPAY
jgi:hypothetical protein